MSSHVARVVGSFEHPILPEPPVSFWIFGRLRQCGADIPLAQRKTMIPAMDFLSCYAIAVNEVNASGGRIVTSPTNGAAGVIPAVLKYIIEVSDSVIPQESRFQPLFLIQFVSDDPEKSIKTFLLTAAVRFVPVVFYDFVYPVSRRLACFSSAAVRSLLPKVDAKPKLEVSNAKNFMCIHPSIQRTSNTNSCMFDGRRWIRCMHGRYATFTRRSFPV